MTAKLVYRGCPYSFSIGSLILKYQGAYICLNIDDVGEGWLFSQGGSYTDIHVNIGTPGAHIHVNMGTRVLIFT